MRLLSKLLATLSLAALVSQASATTVNVTTVGNSFSPKDITINVGDTVHWSWGAAAFHSVTSGVGGAADGIFTSGAPGTNGNFSVVFNQAFLDAHPVSGNLYRYFCDVHVSTFNMVGSVRVNEAPKGPTAYGCGINPIGSLSLLSGALKLGTTPQFGVHNPLGTQPAGSFAFLAISAGSAPGFPCGLALPGFGMSAPGGVGELLLNTTPGVLLPLLPPVLWSGTPAAVNVAIPNNLVLLGAPFFFQGAIFSPAGPLNLGLTDAMRGELGNL